MELLTSTEDMNLLTRCSEEEARLFFHKLLDGVCGRMPPSYTDYSKTWSLEDWWKVTDSCRAIVTLFFRHGWSSQQLMDHVGSVLPQSYLQLVCNALEVRQDDVRQALSDNVSSISHATLTDFDWNTKVVLSNDRLSSIWQPLTQLDLSLSENGNKKLAQVELDETELKKLVTSLEAADRIVSQLT